LTIFPFHTKCVNKRKKKEKKILQHYLIPWKFAFSFFPLPVLDFAISSEVPFSLELFYHSILQDEKNSCQVNKSVNEVTMKKRKT
jgi:hypothetical protein